MYLHISIDTIPSQTTCVVCDTSLHTFDDHVVKKIQETGTFTDDSACSTSGLKIYKLLPLLLRMNTFCSDFSIFPR